MSSTSIPKEQDISSQWAELVSHGIENAIGGLSQMVGQDIQVSKIADDDHESFLNDEYGEEMQKPDPGVQFRQRIVGGLSDLSASLRHIKIALWVFIVLLLISFLVK